jgi:plastocyanin
LLPIYRVLLSRSLCWRRSGTAGARAGTADGTALQITAEPRTITYTVPAQVKGTYEFICDPHAEFMRVTFIVGAQP